MTSPGKKDRASNGSNGAPKSADKSRARPGLPDEESVLSEKTFTSPKGNKYRIIETDETDPYDAPSAPEEQHGEHDDP